MADPSKKERIHELFGAAGPSDTTPSKKQKVLNFLTMTPEATAASQAMEVAEYKAAKQAAVSTEKKAQKAKEQLAKDWGLAWPQPAQSQQRKGREGIT